MHFKIFIFHSVHKASKVAPSDEWKYIITIINIKSLSMHAFFQGGALRESLTLKKSGA